VRSRLHHGSQLPHPRITERRVSAWQLELPRALPVHLDGVPMGAARRLSVRVEPDALRVTI
jgi:diacylglycerol kinase family enzyme